MISERVENKFVLCCLLCVLILFRVCLCFSALPPPCPFAHARFCLFVLLLFLAKNSRIYTEVFHVFIWFLIVFHIFGRYAQISGS